jgi:hypothetical protein
MIIVDSLCQKRKVIAPLRVNGEEGFVGLSVVSVGAVLIGHFPRSDDGQPR